jgi:hypothetical protein
MSKYEEFSSSPHISLLHSENSFLLLLKTLECVFQNSLAVKKVFELEKFRKTYSKVLKQGQKWVFRGIEKRIVGGGNRKIQQI